MCLKQLCTLQCNSISQLAVLCPFLTQGLHFRMCGMRDASTLNFKTSLPHHPLSQETITDRFMARKMLSAGARADARNNLVELIETNCRSTLACCSQLAPAFQNKSPPQEPPTDTSNGTCTNCCHHRTEKNFQDTSHYTEAGSAGLAECEQKHTQ